jgi:hypothetical protein
MYLTGNDLKLEFSGSASDRPTACGSNSFTSGENSRGMVDFTDDGGALPFVYSAIDGKTVWADSATNIWFKSVQGDYDYAFISGDGGTEIEVNWKGAWSYREPATGEYTPPKPNGATCGARACGTGYVDFPDDRRYHFWFYPGQEKISWDTQDTPNSNVWQKVAPQQSANVGVGPIINEGPESLRPLPEPVPVPVPELPSLFGYAMGDMWWMTSLFLLASAINIGLFGYVCGSRRSSRGGKRYETIINETTSSETALV